MGAVDTDALAASPSPLEKSSCGGARIEPSAFATSSAPFPSLHACCSSQLEEPNWKWRNLSLPFSIWGNVLSDSLFGLLVTNVLPLVRSP